MRHRYIRHTLLATYRSLVFRPLFLAKRPVAIHDRQTMIFQEVLCRIDTVSTGRIAVPKLRHRYNQRRKIDRRKPDGFSVNLTRRRFNPPLNPKWHLIKPNPLTSVTTEPEPAIIHFKITLMPGFACFTFSSCNPGIQPTTK